MSKLVIGESGSKQVKIDLELLLSTRLLIQANSGGGKSWAIRRICEQAAGKVQIIIIDPEGEFHTLREKYDFALVGKGGDTPADTRSAALLATKMLEHQFSAVCDLFEMKPSQRHLWVRTFLESMIDAPKELWHPVLVVVDEAHMFCPEKGQGESEATDAMMGLATRGRKRGFCPIFATQRLSALSKTATAMLQNRMIGPTFEDLDLKRAASTLSLDRSEERAVFADLKTAKPGTFWALGRAISTERIRFDVGPVETSHPKIGGKNLEPPPPPKAIKNLLPQLADLPQEAESKQRTEAQLRGEITQLKRELAASKVVSEGKTSIDAKTTDLEIKKRVQEMNRQLVEQVASAENNLKTALHSEIKGIDESLSTVLTAGAEMRETLRRVGRILGQTKTKVEALKSAPIPIASDQPRQMYPVTTRKQSEHTPPPDGVSASQIRILSRLEELLQCTGATSVRKEQLAAWAEYSPNSGGYNNYLGSLRTLGLIEYPTPGFVTITDAGRQLARPEDVPTNSDEILERAKKVLGGSEARILEHVHRTHPEAISKTELAEATEFSANSGGFNNYLGHMRTLGFIDYPTKGHVKCAEWMFL